MSMLSSQSLSRWVSYFKTNDFSQYGIDYMKMLLNIQIKPDFLLQMQERWDPCTHTFRFGNHEMCPTIEEFKAILGVPHEEILQFPCYNTSVRTILKTEYGFPNRVVKMMIKYGTIDLEKLNIELMNRGKICDDERTRLVTIVIILAHYLLSPQDEKPLNNIFIVGIEMRKCYKDPSAIILAETLLGLDKTSRKNQVLKQGSPLLLQIWLMDKLGFLQAQLPSTKCLSLLNQMIRLSTVKVTNVNPLTIRCTLPWYCIKKMIYSMKGKPIIFLMGLLQATFYIPGRIPQQFGLPIVPIMPKGAKINLPKISCAIWNTIQHLPIINEEEEEDEDNFCVIPQICKTIQLMPIINQEEEENMIILEASTKKRKR